MTTRISYYYSCSNAHTHTHTSKLRFRVACLHFWTKISNKKEKTVWTFFLSFDWKYSSSYCLSSSATTTIWADSHVFFAPACGVCGPFSLPFSLPLPRGSWNGENCSLVKQQCPRPKYISCLENATGSSSFLRRVENPPSLGAVAGLVAAVGPERALQPVCSKNPLWVSSVFFCLRDQTKD